MLSNQTISIIDKYDGEIITHNLMNPFNKMRFIIRISNPNETIINEMIESLKNDKLSSFKYNHNEKVLFVSVTFENINIETVESLLDEGNIKLANGMLNYL